MLKWLEKIRDNEKDPDIEAIREKQDELDTRLTLVERRLGIVRAGIDIDSRKLRAS